MCPSLLLTLNPTPRMVTLSQLGFIKKINKIQIMGSVGFSWVKLVGFIHVTNLKWFEEFYSKLIWRKSLLGGEVKF